MKLIKNWVGKIKNFDVVTKTPSIALPPTHLDASPEWLQGVSEETGSFCIGPDP